jgi:hypothetical protein
LAIFPENLDEHEAEAVTVKELQATIQTGSDKLQVARCEIAPGDRHGKGSIPQRKRNRRASLCASQRLCKVTFGNQQASELKANADE